MKKSCKSFRSLAWIAILSVITVLFQSCNAEHASLEFKRLTCESLENPMGIEEPNPLFSWVVFAEGYDRSQSAYQVLVATNLGSLKPGKADMWDSGPIRSDQSIHLAYGGKALNASRRYFWTVKVWDQEGLESQWADPQFFEMGLLQPGDWRNAAWISLHSDHRSSTHRFREVKTQRMKEPVIKSSHAAGYFRKGFELSGTLREARAYICGLGYYELYLNGQKVGDHVLDPQPTSYDHHALYVTHDLTPYIGKGENTLGVILGNGFYGQDIAFTGNLSYGQPAFRVLLKIEYENGSSEYLISDNSWKAGTGPIVFDNVYAGESYDARFEIEGWADTGFDDSDWKPVKVVSPKVESIRSQLMPPIRKILELEPVRLFQGSNGNWIADFGQNIAGWVKIAVEEEEGSVIEVRTVEALTRSGDEIHPGSLGKSATGVNQLDVYVCKGDGKEEWEPRFTYQAFQFAEISGLSKKPAPGDITAVLVCNDMQETGSFSCSDPLLERMVEVSKWTVIDNLHGFPEDCPAREKCGWLGDAHATAQFNLYTYDMALLYQKYSEDIESQLIVEHSGKPGDSSTFRVPTMVAPGKRAIGAAALDWGIAQVYIPWYAYLHYGDWRSVQLHYADMKELVNYYLTFKNEVGTIENGLGDWCPPLWDRASNPGAMECHPYISATAYFYDILGIVTLIAQKMEDVEFAQELQKEAEALKVAFNKEFLLGIGSGNDLWYGSQTATVMALRFNLVPEELLEKVVSGLLYDIVDIKGGHHATGIHGNRYLYTMLNELGEDELSHQLLTRPEFPSQAYILQSGLTTWPERQWEWDSGIEWDRSLNHPMQAGFGAFFYESLAGIRPLPQYPGFRKFRLEPSFWQQLEYAGAEIQTPYGPILSNWSRTDKLVEWQVLIPFNTVAEIALSPDYLTTLSIVQEDGSVVSDQEAMTGSEIVLGSGTYNLTFKAKKPELKP